MIKLTATLISTLLLAGTAHAGPSSGTHYSQAGDAYDRSYEGGVQVYRGYVPTPNYQAILSEQARVKAVAARKAKMKQSQKMAKKRLALMKRQTRALEEIAEGVDDLSRRGGTGGNIGYGGYGYGFNGLFTDRFPQTRGVRLNPPGALRPRIVPGSGGVRY